MLTPGELFVKNKGGVYLFDLEQGRVLFKLLPYESYRSYKHTLLLYPQFKTQVEDEIWEANVLEHSFGRSLGDIESGTVTTVANVILWLSCPKNVDLANATLQGARMGLEDAIQQAILFICEAFPSYLPDTIEAMDWSVIATRLAQAELILGRHFEFKTPDSQPVDDSGKIFERLDEFSTEHVNVEDLVNAPAVDFDKTNRQLQSEEMGKPAGDFNLRNIRG